MHRSVFRASHFLRLLKVNSDWRDLQVAAVQGEKPGKLALFDNVAEAVKDAWLVIEAIPERLSIKQDVFAQLEEYAPSNAILASNSSSFKSREIAVHLKTAYRGELYGEHSLFADT